MQVRSFFLATAVVVVLGCSERALNTGAQPLASISDGASGGNPHFFFLPPLVANPGAGTNDATLSPVVEVCDWDGTACVAMLAHYTTDLSTTTTTQAGNSETVRLGDGHFIVNWHSELFDLNATHTYRICVKVGDTPLGFADVDVVSSGNQLRTVSEGYVALVDGRTLPIVFRIEPGALDDSSAGGCGGQAT